MKRIGVYILLLLTLCILTGCEEQQSDVKTDVFEITTLEELPKNEEYVELSQENKEKVCKFVFEQSDKTVMEYVENAYRKTIESVEGIELEAFNIAKDTMMVDAEGKKPLNNFNVDLRILTDVDNELSEDDKYKSINKLSREALYDVRSSDMLVSLRVKKIHITFVDKDTGSEYTQNVSMDMRGGLFGIQPNQPEGEAEAMELIGEILKIDGEAFTKLNPTETYTRTRMDKFGPIDKELYIEITIFVPRDDDADILPKLADEIANALKTEEAAKKYMKTQGFETIKILLKSSLFGNLEYEYSAE